MESTKGDLLHVASISTSVRGLPNETGTTQNITLENMLTLGLELGRIST